MKIRRDSSGVHFFDRRSGLNVLWDDISVPPPEWDSAPRFVSLALTNACDLQCRFCYAPKHPARLEPETVLAWAIELDETGCLGLGFGGGEPTLYPHFPLLCRRIAEETHLAVSFTTHGHRITEDMATQLKGAVHFLRVSVDGVGATYERVRGRPFEALIDKLELLRTIAPFGVNFVVNADTFNDLDDAAALAFEHGASEMLLLPERAVAGTGGIDPTTSRALATWIQRNRQYRLAISDLSTVDGVPIAAPFRSGSGLDAFAHIDAVGHLRASSFSDDGEPIQSSVGAALAELRMRRGDSA